MTILENTQATKTTDEPVYTGYKDIDTFLDDCLDTMRKKGHDYRQGNDDDLLHNFRTVAEMVEIPMEKVWFVYFYKHFSAMTTFIKEGGQSESEPIEGRIKDQIVYLLLMYRLSQEMKTRNVEVAKDVNPMFRRLQELAGLRPTKNRTDGPVITEAFVEMLPKDLLERAKEISDEVERRMDDAWRRGGVMTPMPTEEQNKFGWNHKSHDTWTENGETPQTAVDAQKFSTRDVMAAGSLEVTKPETPPSQTEVEARVNETIGTQTPLLCGCKGECKGHQEPTVIMEVTNADK